MNLAPQAADSIAACVTGTDDGQSLPLERWGR